MIDCQAEINYFQSLHMNNRGSLFCRLRGSALTSTLIPDVGNATVGRISKNFTENAHKQRRSFFFYFKQVRLFPGISFAFLDCHRISRFFIIFIADFERMV